MIDNSMSATKRQDLPTQVRLSPGLWVIATPIGNLEDFSPRGRAALAQADRILCEDTRRTRALTAHLGLDTLLVRFDRHTPQRQLQKWIEELSQTEGMSFALVSDAGTPGVSDPGANLVRLAHEAGVVVTPVPGPSAPLTLLSASGFESQHFAFYGFFPRKESERQEEIRKFKISDARIGIWFESPQRVLEVLNRFTPEISGARWIVGKELTKLHEKLFSGPGDFVLRAVQAEIESQGELGEWCFAVEKPPSVPVAQAASTWGLALECLIEAGVPPSDAARRISQKFGVSKGISKNEVYAAALVLAQRLK